jgi:hypothetical protein
MQLPGIEFGAGNLDRMPNMITCELENVDYTHEYGENQPRAKNG